MLIILAFVVYARWFYVPRAPDPLLERIADQIEREEPKVIEAFINDARVMYVTVLDDGTRRDGYACYLCDRLNARRASVWKVNVVAAGSHRSSRRDNAYGILLGDCECK
jgi:hypothetical protein